MFGSDSYGSMGALTAGDCAAYEWDIIGYLPTMHDYNTVFGKFKLGSRKKDIGQSQRNGAKRQVQRTSITIISKRNHEIRS